MKRNFKSFVIGFVVFAMLMSGIGAMASTTDANTIGSDVTTWLFQDNFDSYTIGAANASGLQNVAAVPANAEGGYSATIIAETDRGNVLKVSDVNGTNGQQIQYKHNGIVTDNNRKQYMYKSFYDFGAHQSDRLVISFDIKLEENTRTGDFVINVGKTDNAVAKFRFLANGHANIVTANADGTGATWKELEKVYSAGWHTVKFIYDRATYSVDYYIDDEFVTCSYYARKYTDDSVTGAYMNIVLQPSWVAGAYGYSLDNYKVGYADAQINMGTVHDTSADKAIIGKAHNNDTTVITGIDYFKGKTADDIKGKTYLFEAEVDLDYSDVNQDNPRLWVGIDFKTSNSKTYLGTVIPGEKLTSAGNYHIIKNSAIDGSNNAIKFSEATYIDNTEKWGTGDVFYSYRIPGLFKQDAQGKTEKVKFQVISCVNETGTDSIVYVYANGQLMAIQNTQDLTTSKANPNGSGKKPNYSGSNLVVSGIFLGDNYWYSAGSCPGGSAAECQHSSGIKGNITNIRFGELADTTTTLFRVLDSNNKPIKDLNGVNAETELKIDARVKNNTGVEKKVLPIFAKYTGGRLDDISLDQEFSLAGNSNVTVDTTITKGTSNKVSAFLWNGLGNIIPYAKAITLE